MSFSSSTNNIHDEVQLQFSRAQKEELAEHGHEMLHAATSESDDRAFEQGVASIGKNMLTDPEAAKNVVASLKETADNAVSHSDPLNKRQILADAKKRKTKSMHNSYRIRKKQSGYPDDELYDEEFDHLDDPKSYPYGTPAIGIQNETSGPDTFMRSESLSNMNSMLTALPTEAGFGVNNVVPTGNGYNRSESLKMIQSLIGEDSNPDLNIDGLSTHSNRSLMIKMESDGKLTDSNRSLMQTVEDLAHLHDNVHHENDIYELADRLATFDPADVESMFEQPLPDNSHGMKQEQGLEFNGGNGLFSRVGKIGGKIEVGAASLRNKAGSVVRGVSRFGKDKKAKVSKRISQVKTESTRNLSGLFPGPFGNTAAHPMVSDIQLLDPIMLQHQQPQVPGGLSDAKDMLGSSNLSLGKSLDDFSQFVDGLSNIPDEHTIKLPEKEDMSYVNEAPKKVKRLQVKQESTGSDAERSRQQWSKAEDQVLEQAVKRFGTSNWRIVAENVPGRSNVQCRARWGRVLRPGLRKGYWSQEEDAVLTQLVLESKALSDDQTIEWNFIKDKIPGRSIKQCRERWLKNLDPNVKKGGWTKEEDDIILEQQNKLGNRWALISRMLDGRTEHSVKTRWRSLTRSRKREWTKQDDERLLELHAQLGNKWDVISEKFPTRTKNAVMTRFKSLSR